MLCTRKFPKSPRPRPLRHEIRRGPLTSAGSLTGRSPPCWLPGRSRSLRPASKEPEAVCSARPSCACVGRPQRGRGPEGGRASSRGSSSCTWDFGTLHLAEPVLITTSALYMHVYIVMHTHTHMCRHTYRHVYTHAHTQTYPRHSH